MDVRSGAAGAAQVTPSRIERGCRQPSGLDDVVTPSFPILAKVKDVPLHLFRERLELVPESGVYLPLTGDEVGNPPVRSEISDNDDCVVGQDKFFQTFLVSSVHDIGEDGLAVATEEVLDDIGADFAVVGVVEGVAHILFLFDYITKITLFSVFPVGVALAGQPKVGAGVSQIKVYLCIIN